MKEIVKQKRTAQKLAHCKGVFIRIRILHYSSWTLHYIPKKSDVVNWLQRMLLTNINTIDSISLRGYAIFIFWMAGSRTSRSLTTKVLLPVARHLALQLLGLVIAGTHTDSYSTVADVGHAAAILPLCAVWGSLGGLLCGSGKQRERERRVMPMRQTDAPYLGLSTDSKRSELTFLVLSGFCSHHHHGHEQHSRHWEYTPHPGCKQKASHKMQHTHAQKKLSNFTHHHFSPGLSCWHRSLKLNQIHQCKKKKLRIQFALFASITCTTPRNVPVFWKETCILHKMD